MAGRKDGGTPNRPIAQSPGTDTPATPRPYGLRPLTPVIVMRPRLLALTLLAAQAASLPAQSPPASLTYLANMGVLLDCGGRRVVIDGLHRGALAEYAAVPPALLAALEQARPPVARLDLALSTHRHHDHFDAASVAARLGADSGTRYLAATETVDSLYARTALAAAHPRVLGVDPPAGGEKRLTVARLELSVLHLPHNPTPSPRVANVGFLLDCAGLRILHVGDADPTAANYDPHRLASRPVDIAIVPFWYLTGADDTVRRSIGARLWVASHIPLADTAAVRRQVLNRVPGAVVLARPGEEYALRVGR